VKALVPDSWQKLLRGSLDPEQWGSRTLQNINTARRASPILSQKRGKKGCRGKTEPACRHPGTLPWGHSQREDTPALLGHELRLFAADLSEADEPDGQHTRRREENPHFGSHRTNADDLRLHEQPPTKRRTLTSSFQTQVDLHKTYETVTAIAKRISVHNRFGREDQLLPETTTDYQSQIEATDAFTRRWNVDSSDTGIGDAAVMADTTVEIRNCCG
jgi:hypothetical protein